ncbi:MAG: potassium transporter, partial [Alphaproteobacteria bacterium]|nr:potassium transporter [Alphaproteobacteria bacterium]
MDSGGLFNIFIFLVAACAVVPLATRFKLGAVLGYLLSGVLIGPFALGFISNVEEVMHFAEFGVVMMLFLIGLELDPSTLWRLRRTIVGLGGAQVVLTSAVFTGVGVLFGFSLPVSLAVGMALSLSSTAIVLQMLEERNLLRTAAGESAFSVLLFQDISVIFILIILPLLAVGGVAVEAEHSASLLEHLPAWQHALAIAAVIVAIIFGGRYLSSYLFDFVARTRLREVTTATSLALVVGTTLLMYAIGLSPALGAFLAGVVLANSEYKHSLETDIQPFKGLLLGLFFISVGMGINFDLMVEHPFIILGLLAALIGVKLVLLLGLGKLIRLHGSQNIIFAFGLCQGSEFAFVLFQYS